MGVWRKWIFPSLRLVVFAVIAVALVKIAFFPDPSGSDPLASPTGELSDPVYSVALGTVANDVSVSGTVEADAGVTIKAVAAGTVNTIFAAQGATVAPGDKIFDIRIETPREPVERTNDDGTITVEQRDPLVKYETVTAPTAGVVTSLTVIPKQLVAVGEASGTVTPATFSVTGALDPAQQYRLVQRPSEASVAIVGGPAPFTCTNLTISSGTGGAASPDPMTGEGGTPSAGSSVRCAVPAEVTVFAGVSAQITIPAGVAENVLVVPTTAVEGGAQTGVVYVVAADGAHEPRDVTLGLTDGTNVEVTGGLAEGDTILQFTPNAVAPPLDECIDYGDGNVVCGAAP